MSLEIGSEPNSTHLGATCFQISVQNYLVLKCIEVFCVYVCNKTLRIHGNSKIKIMETLLMSSVEFEVFNSYILVIGLTINVHRYIIL